MAKRFGRNQRRKLRAEVSRLQWVASDHYERMRGEARKRLEAERALVDYASHILAVLGAQSAFRNECASYGTDLASFEAYANGLPVRVTPPDPVGMVGNPKDDHMVATAHDIIEAFAVYAGRTENTAELAAHVRFEITAPDGRAAMVVDRRTLDGMRAGSQQLTQYLLRQLVAPWQRGMVR
jgi:hypothetical protein